MQTCCIFYVTMSTLVIAQRSTLPLMRDELKRSGTKVLPVFYWLFIFIFLAGVHSVGSLWVDNFCFVDSIPAARSLNSEIWIYQKQIIIFTPPELSNLVYFVLLRHFLSVTWSAVRNPRKFGRSCDKGDLFWPKIHRLHFLYHMEAKQANIVNISNLVNPVFPKKNVTWLDLHVSNPTSTSWLPLFVRWQ